MADKVPIVVKEKDFDYNKDSCTLQMYVTVENPLARKLEEEDEDGLELGDDQGHDDLLDEDGEAGEGGEDDLDDGNDGFDDAGVVEIDDADQKEIFTPKPKDNEKLATTQKVKSSTMEDASPVTQKKPTGKKLLKDEEDEDEKEMLSNLNIIRKTCTEKNR